MSLPPPKYNGWGGGVKYVLHTLSYDGGKAWEQGYNFTAK